MRRIALPFFFAFALTLAVACSDDTTNSSTCGAGTELVNGVCVPINTSDTNVAPTDTTPQGTNNPTDTTSTTNTNPTDTTPVNTDCTPEEAGVGIPGSACTKDCQCSQELGLRCYSGIYLEGFSFCTRRDEGPLDTNTYPSIILQPSCFGGADKMNGEANKRIYTKACTSIEDCKALASAYTHCGTSPEDFSWSAGSCGQETCCLNITPGTDERKTMAGRKTCIIDSLPPYSYSSGAETPE